MLTAPAVKTPWESNPRRASDMTTKGKNHDNTGVLKIENLFSSKLLHTLINTLLSSRIIQLDNLKAAKGIQSDKPLESLMLLSWQRLRQHVSNIPS